MEESYSFLLNGFWGNFYSIVFENNLVVNEKWFLRWWESVD